MPIQATYKVDSLKILRLMREKGLRQSHLALHLNVTDRTVRNWLNLKKEVQFQNMINLGKVLDVDWQELLYDASNRKNLLENVRKACIKDILEQSRKDLPYQLELTIEQQFDFIKTPWDDVLPQKRKGTSWSNKTIDKAFKDLDQAILIHGVEGSGKTRILLELMEVMLEEAVQNYDSPIPAVFYLPSWSNNRCSLEAWLVTELNKLYEVPDTVGLDFLKAGKILPLFEDLGRVSVEHRTACVDAINLYLEKQRKKYGRVPVVVCCRTTNLKELDSQLHLRGEIVIKNPIKKELDMFVRAAGDDFPIFLDIDRADEIQRDIPNTPFLLATLYEIYTVTMSNRNLHTLDSRTKNAISVYVSVMLHDCELTSNYAYKIQYPCPKDMELC